MSLAGMETAMTVEGATTAKIFEACVEHFLTPPTMRR
jgi:hypothetical protein